MTDTHRQRDRAESFGRDAVQYDRARPGYPPALVSDLVGLVAARAPGAGARGAGTAADVLDVGCGTGKAARGFAAAGCRVLGIEIDERMAAVARAGGLSVEVAPFEAWEPAGRRFDLVVSGQAWHWVDPGLAPRRAAAALGCGGSLAPFWNYREPPREAAEVAAVTAVYLEEAPELVPANGQVGMIDKRSEIEQHAGAIEASGCFEPCEVWRYPWSETLALDRYIERLATQSEHRLLAPERLARLLAGVREVLAARADTVEVAYTTHCIVARLR